MSLASAASTPTCIANFEVLAKIGEGGMGAVYKARDPDLDRIVAIKLLRHGFDSPELRERLKLEARSAASLESRHIVTVHAFGVHEGAPFLVMEFVRGTTLERLIGSRHQLPLVQKLRLMEALCEGLAFAHQKRVIHRDIKPSNLILSADGVLKILDFGIAKAVSGAGLTKTRVLMGTPNYMSPEQVLNTKAVDTRSDIFAVGAVFYEVLTYERAFPGEYGAALDAVLHGQPEPLARCCPTIDPQIDAVVSRALCKDVQQRYQTLTEMGRDIVAIRERLSDPAKTTVIIPGSTTPTRPPHSGDDLTISLAEIAATLQEELGTPDPLPEQASEQDTHSGGTPRRVALWAGVALVAVTLAISGVWLSRPPASPTADRRAEGSKQPAPPQPTVGGGTDTATDAGSPLGNPAEAIARELDALHHVTMTALAHDNFAAALQSVIDAENISPANPDVQKDVDLILQSAARDVDRRFQQKSAITLDPQSTAHFRVASASRRDASRLRNSGRKIEAIQALAAARGALAKINPPAAKAKNGPAQPKQAGTASPIENPPPVAPITPLANSGGRPTETGAKSTTPSTTSIPPVTEPRKPDPPPSSPPTMSDRAMIDGVLQQYISAYEHQDATALRRVWPTMPEDLRSMITQNKSYRLTLTNVEVTIQGNSATVACTRQISVQPMVGQRQTASPSTTILLRRGAEGWVITDVR